MPSATSRVGYGPSTTRYPSSVVAGASTLAGRPARPNSPARRCDQSWFCDTDTCTYSGPSGPTESPVAAAMAGAATAAYREPPRGSQLVTAQRSAAPPATRPRGTSESGVTATTSDPCRASTDPFGVTTGRSSCHVVNFFARVAVDDGESQPPAQRDIDAVPGGGEGERAGMIGEAHERHVATAQRIDQRDPGVAGDGDQIAPPRGRHVAAQLQRATRGRLIGAVVAQDPPRL